MRYAIDFGNQRIELRAVDPAVDAAWAARDVRPPAGTARLDSEGFTAIETNITKHYKTVTLPTMSTGATDMAYLRARGVQCFGVGPMTDVEDGPKGWAKLSRAVGGHCLEDLVQTFRLENESESGLEREEFDEAFRD